MVTMFGARGIGHLTLMVALVYCLLSVGECCAQSFGPPVPTELVLVLLDREGNVRFTLSGYYARWENPFRVTLTATDSFGAEVTQKFRFVAETPSSPLLEGKLVVSRRWAVGFWYNPIRGEQLRTDVYFKGVDAAAAVVLARDTNLADVHVIYSMSNGFTAQLGYYREWGTIRDLRARTESDYTLQSWNVWLTKRLDLLIPGRLVSERLDLQFIPFVSAGYHPSSGLNHAVSVLTGVAITFRERISLSTTLWLFDLNNVATRVTGGLVIQY
jgi:hypothetical protein